MPSYYQIIRLILLSIFFFQVLGIAEAQKKNKRRENGAFIKQKKQPNRKDLANIPFAQTQWWIGFRMGGNLTQASPQDRFSVFSSTISTDPTIFDKSYEDFNKLGAQAGAEFTFYHQGFSISLQPNYRRQRFTYNNDYLWTDPLNEMNTLMLDYSQDHQLDFIEFPLFIKYDLTRTKLRPYVQVGFYYAILINANKDVSIRGLDMASGGVDEFTVEEFSLGVDNLFIRSSIGLIGGVGVSYPVGNIRLAFDVNYRHGLNNIADVQNRFTENRLVGIGDVLDNIQLRNIDFSFGVLFPMRYLVSKNYRVVD